MGWADPVVVLAMALGAGLVGWPPAVADPREALRRLILALAGKAQVQGVRAAAAGLGLTALGGVCGAAAVWFAVDQVAFTLRGRMPLQGAMAAQGIISALLLVLAFDLPLSIRSHRDAPEGAEAIGLRWTRGAVTPLLLYAFGGLYAAVAYRGALEAWRALAAEPATEGAAQWAERAVALVHYLPARIGALAACVVRGRGAWQRLQAVESAGPWHGEWAAAALDSTPARVLRASGVVLAVCLLVMRW